MTKTSSTQAASAPAQAAALTRTRWLWWLVALPLASCGGGGGSSDPTATAPPPPAAAPSPAPSPPAPAPAPAPAPSPPAPAPAPAAGVPPLAATKIVLDGQPLGAIQFPDPDQPGGGQGQDIDGETCVPTGSATPLHIHSHLSIFRDGQQIAVPSHVGRITGCAYDTHTHDHSGVLHVEAPATATYKLGQFFSVWGMPLTNTNLAGVTDPNGAPFVIYIYDNFGTAPNPPRLYTGDIREIELAPQREITVQIGSPLTELQTYDWSMVSPEQGF
jgi:hypothetical protein